MGVAPGTGGDAVEVNVASSVGVELALESAGLAAASVSRPAVGSFSLTVGLGVADGAVVGDGGAAVAVALGDRVGNGVSVSVSASFSAVAPASVR